jgi:sulfoquinovose isomerase
LLEHSGTTSFDAGWLSSPAHHSWLLSQVHQLLSFYQYTSSDPKGGFFQLDDYGRPQPVPERQLVVTSRMVHSFSLAHMLGCPGAAPLIDHGLRFLKDTHRDRRHGGYYWVVDHEGPVDASKQAYGHAFVLLAASSAVMAERPGAAELLDDIWSILEQHFWSESDGLIVEEYEEDWTGPGPYRGQNSNMHLVEALLTSFEATGDQVYLQRATRIAERLIPDLTAKNGWYLAEHYTENWEFDPEYNRDDPENVYRPYGSVVGHWMEWSRLLLQLRASAESPPDWMLNSSRRLFDSAVSEAWDKELGGFVYTVDFDGTALNRDRYWWPVCEAIGAAAMLADVTRESQYEQWYRTFWDFADRCLIDHGRGSWQHLLDPTNSPKHVPGVVTGKWDLYHSLQSCLIPLLPSDAGIGASLRDNRFRLPMVTTMSS